MNTLYSHFINYILRMTAKPLIDKLVPLGHTKDGRSVNIEEGSTLVLECNANSSEPVLFQWFTIHNTSDNNKGRLQTRGNVTDGDYRSTLTIESTTLDDRAYYECIAKNSIGEISFVMLVRVKDKWMALWPFLGIVGEVIILCTIIFIYEKRRQKPDFDDSSDNANEK
ncbi:Basigin-like protein [Leptotrombidium deliense]|uniref:Basigin-like protein n=1 Tax=Leptotrombidium deliense TaxID=299467 RepID=A0A443SD72_9ACAR|nr:Basigin-like protein [Leptotrombidium deliense]